MDSADVIFPLDLGPLTYRIPSGLRDALLPGMLVRAEIKKTLKTGIVAGPALNPPAKGLKDIAETLGDVPALSEPMLRLIKWMSGYYFSTEGAVLKTVFPEEFWQLRPHPDARQAAGLMPPAPMTTLPSQPLAEALREGAKKKSYKAFLLHAPSTGHELSFLLEALGALGNVIVLCPELEELKAVSDEIGAVAGERLAVLHSGLKKKARREALERIISGRADIVLGSRMALFAPLKEVSLIAVLQEESVSYREEGGVRYGARDMAVMRGYFEKSVVLLSSICPSVESYHNALTGKYTLIEPPPQRRPKVRLIHIRGSESPISGKLIGAAFKRLEKKEPVMFLINRKGYSMLLCVDCGRLERCPACDIPLVFHKSEKALRCGYCGAGIRPPDLCADCGGLMTPLGSGIERVEEELRRLFSPVRGVSLPLEVMVGTKALTRRPALRGKFSLVGIINSDAFLHAPDFRSSERAFSELAYAAQTLRAGGEMIIQAKNPGAAFFSHARKLDFKGFYKSLLSERASLMYPPFGRMALLTFEGDKRPEGVMQALPAGLKEGMALLGPVLMLTKRGKKLWRLLIKAPSRKQLEGAVNGIKKRFKAGVEVDPAGL